MASFSRSECTHTRERGPCMALKVEHEGASLSRYRIAQAGANGRASFRSRRAPRLFLMLEFPVPSLSLAASVALVACIWPTLIESD